MELTLNNFFYVFKIYCNRYKKKKEKYTKTILFEIFIPIKYQIDSSHIGDWYDKTQKDLKESPLLIETLSSEIKKFISNEDKEFIDTITENKYFPYLKNIYINNDLFEFIKKTLEYCCNIKTFEYLSTNSLDSFKKSKGKLKILMYLSILNEKGFIDKNIYFFNKNNVEYLQEHNWIYKYENYYLNPNIKNLLLEYFIKNDENLPIVIDFLVDIVSKIKDIQFENYSNLFENCLLNIPVNKQSYRFYVKAGLHFQQSSKYLLALKYYNKILENLDCIEIFQATKIFNNIANISESISDVESSFDIYHNLINIFEKIKNYNIEKILFRIYNNFGVLLTWKNDYFDLNKAELLFKLCLQIEKNKFLADCSIDELCIWNNIATIKFYKGNYDEAIKIFYDLYEEFSKRKYDKKFLIIEGCIFCNIACCYIAQKKPICNSQYFFDKALNYYFRIYDKKNLLIGKIYRLKALCYLMYNDYYNSHIFYVKSLWILEQKNNKNYYRLTQIYQELSILYNKLGDPIKSKYYDKKILKKTILKEVKIEISNSKNYMNNFKLLIENTNPQNISFTTIEKSTMNIKWRLIQLHRLFQSEL